MRMLLSLAVAVVLGVPATSGETHDLVVYGGTSAGVIAAVQAKAMGASVVLVGPDKHLGGLSAGGLGWTDSGKKEVIGGLARDFYHRVHQHYAKPEAWKWQGPNDYGKRGVGDGADNGKPTRWTFEPHVAEGIYEDLVREHGIPVHRAEYLDRESGVVKDGTRIRSIRMLSGLTFRGRAFIDATYEGDLMAAAGVSHTVGRESNASYGETMNGVQTARAVKHQFEYPVSAYKVAGDPASGLLARISPEKPGPDGSPDKKVQAYCFRTCMTNHPGNRVPFPKPPGYDAAQYELCARYLQGGWSDVFRKFDPIPNRKTDTNNHGGFSFDNIGYNYEYPEAGYERRKEIIAEHRVYQQGLLWFLANDERVPEKIRRRMNEWGLARDEFTDNGNWPHQIYVREARRMVSEFVMTENHLTGKVPTEQPVGMGSYNMDSHNVQRYVDARGNVRNEGDIQVNPGGPYPIDYRAILPRKSECANLLVPVCLSSSHIAYGSIRMEPVFMILGQSAATAVVMALQEGLGLHDLPYERLREGLLADGQVLEYKGPRRSRAALIPLQGLKGVVVDDTAATLTGPWQMSTIAAGVHEGYLHDGDLRDGSCGAKFAADLEPGRYEVQVAYTPNQNRATNVPVTITGAGKPLSFTINQRETPNRGVFHSLGITALNGAVMVELGNRGTDGHVIADAVRFLPTPER